MAFTLPPLPYAPEALAPHISAETLSFHHGKHHQGYTTNLNNATLLDDRHDAGDLDDETWSAERVVLMNNLRTVTAEMERLETKRGAGNRG